MHMAGGSLVVVLVALAALSGRSVLAAMYSVFGDGGCSTEWAFGCMYVSWPASHNFLVDDRIVFRFDAALNDVTSVSAEVYNTCENGVSPLPKQFYTTSPTVLNLPTTGDYYFISLVTRDSSYYCNQKVHITVGSSSTTPSTPSPPTPDPPSTPSPPTPTNTSSSGNTTTSPSTLSPSKSRERAIIDGVTGALLGLALLAAKLCLIRHCMEKRRKKKYKISVAGEDLVFRKEMDDFDQRKVII